MRSLLSFPVFLLLFFLLPPSAWGERSWFRLPTTNGHTAVVYDAQAHKIDTMLPHLYRQYHEGTAETPDLCFDTYFGVRRGGENRWLDTVAEDTLGYTDRNGRPGTGIIRSVQRVLDYEITSYFFAPFEAPGDLLLMLVHVRNVGNATPGALFALMNFHTGPGGTEAGESISYAPDEFTERGAFTMVYRSLRPATHYAADTGPSERNPWKLVEAGETLDDHVLSGTHDDLVAAFQFDFSLGPGESTWYGVGIAHGESDAEAARRLIDDFVGGRTPEALLEAEFAQWEAWHRRETLPAGLSRTEEDLFRQSTAVLRMGQVREPGRAEGQILASLPPGRWNISWARDAAYAIAALVESGHEAEARAALLFMLKNDAGATGRDYSAFVGTSDYRISVARYYGNGDEWSDGGDDPNIEWDDFGLFLWALGRYAERYGMAEIVEPNWGIVSHEIADVLLSLIDSDGLLVADSSIWERHWYAIDGGRKKFTFSSLTAARGLREAAKMAEFMRDRERRSTYEAAAERIETAIETLLVTPAGELRSSKEETTDYYDAAVVEAFNFDVLDPRGAVADATLAAFDLHLPAPAPESPGYIRNDDGSFYDSQEWVKVDLRVANAWMRLGDARRGGEIFDWIVRQGADNFYLLSELLDAEGRYAGEVPMVGYGAGAFILSLDARRSTSDRPGCGFFLSTHRRRASWPIFLGLLAAPLAVMLRRRPA